jgi:hypothetical protein
MPFRKDVVQSTAQALFGAGIVAVAIVQVWQATRSAAWTLVAALAANGLVGCMKAHRKRRRNALLPVLSRFPGSTAV